MNKIIFFCVMCSLLIVSINPILGDGTKTASNQSLASSRVVDIVNFSHGDTFNIIKNKNPDIIFNLNNSLDGLKEYKIIQGQYIATTTTTMIFDAKDRIVYVSMKKNAAALDIYEPLEKKYNAIYGSPKNNRPMSLSRDMQTYAASASWENTKGSAHLIMVIFIDETKVPWVMLIETFTY